MLICRSALDIGFSAGHTACSSKGNGGRVSIQSCLSFQITERCADCVHAGNTLQQCYRMAYGSVLERTCVEVGGARCSAGSVGAGVVSRILRTVEGMPGSRGLKVSGSRGGAWMSMVSCGRGFRRLTGAGSGSVAALFCCA